MVGIVVYWVLALIKPFEWMTNPLEWRSNYYGAKIENKLDSLYEYSFVNYKDMPPLLEKLKNKEKFKDTYNFYKGYYITKSEVRDSFLEDSSPEGYLNSVSKSSKYYGDSKMILFLYYYTMYKEGSISVDFFIKKLNLQISDMENNKIEYPYHFFLAQYDYFNSNISISEIYSNYNYMQKSFKIRYDPPYNRTPATIHFGSGVNIENEIKKYHY